MAVWQRGITRELHKDAKRTYRLINRSNVNISSVSVESDPSDITVTENTVGQQVNLTVSGGNVGTEYEVKPTITFADGDIDSYPILVTFWE